MPANEIALGLNAGRIAYGMAAAIAPKTTSLWIGRKAASDPATAPMIRAFGIRDVALGAATIGAIQGSGMKGMGTRILLALGVMVDVVDVAAGHAARDAVPAAKGIYAVAGGAALAGVAALGLSVAASTEG